MKTKYIIFYGMNVAAFLFTLSYKILYSVGLMALKYAETAQPLEESGIYVFLTFGHIFFVVGIVIVMYLNIVMFNDVVRDYIKKKNRGWL